MNATYDYFKMLFVEHDQKSGEHFNQNHLLGHF